MGIKTAEGGLVKGVLELFELHGIMAWRNNSGALRDRNGRLVRYGKVGSADVLAVLPGGRFMCVEAKVPGNKPTPAQEAFLESVHSRGAVAIWVTSLATLEAVLSALEAEPEANFTISGTREA